MGCLNSEGKFRHWFGNIHLSGPCSRACYFCIGQHMMALDRFNNLDKWPLDDIQGFVEKCLDHNVNEVNVTGSNTDPLLYKHTNELKDYLSKHIRNLKFGLRTNASIVDETPEIFSLYDKASVTICSFNPEIYQKMMGRGSPPEIEKIMQMKDRPKNLKVNIVLGPENTSGAKGFGDLVKTLRRCIDAGISRINLREPYGQPHIGDPLSLEGMEPYKITLGMPTYKLFDWCEITYWDVHYVEVESVNLYANGVVSVTYPITKGHHAKGTVKDQSKFPLSGRMQEQWLY